MCIVIIVYLQPENEFNGKTCAHTDNILRWSGSEMNEHLADIISIHHWNMFEM